MLLILVLASQQVVSTFKWKTIWLIDKKKAYWPTSIDVKKRYTVFVVLKMRRK